MWPYWNASGGSDHLWAIARDAGACATPWGSLLEVIRMLPLTLTLTLTRTLALTRMPISTCTLYAWSSNLASNLERGVRVEVGQMLGLGTWSQT